VAPALRLVTALAAVAAVAVTAPAAYGGPIIDRAADALRIDPVYVDPTAERAISDAEADDVRDRIAQADAGPIYVAILPAAARNETGGDPTEVARALAEELRRDGTYAVIVGDQFRAGSTNVRGTGALADEAFAAHGDEGVAATLIGFIDSVERRARGEEGGGSEERGDGPGVGVIVPLLAVGGLGFFLFRRFRRRRGDDVELAEVKAAAQEDLLALAEDIRNFDLDVEMPGAPAEARADYERALAMYEKADRALDRARRPEDLEEVTAAIEEGRWAMTSAKARLEGREPPERRPPCFFDPRHGPSDRDVEWAPPWGAPRVVPACEADAQRVEQGLEPASREVMVSGRRTPYWDAPPAYGPWAGGFFGGFGGLFPGLLIGSMLGHAFAPPVYIDAGGEGGDEFSDGDFGGGDFGGGDFGGGDFGGGDFGGGGGGE
jgi:hypothetical protein